MSNSVKEATENSFEREVLQSDRPVLVDFWAEWCGPCRMMEPTIKSIADEHQAAVSVVKVNVDDNPETSGRYGIKGIPTLILFSDGKEVERVVGATSKESISRLLEKYTNPEKQAA